MALEGNDTAAEPTNGGFDLQADKSRLTLPRGWTILGRLVLAGIGSGIIVDSIWFVAGADSSSPLRTATLMLLADCLFGLFIARLMSKAGLDPMKVFGQVPESPLLSRYALMALPMLLLSIASVYLLFLPLSYVMPRFVQFWLIDCDSTVIWTDGSGCIAANLIRFCEAVLIAPILEEFIFRGLLLGRWASKSSVHTGMIASSVIFGLLHSDILGAFFFGYIMAVLYIQTKSLFVPITIHAMNNCTCWFMEAGEILAGTSDVTPTIADFQSCWWVGLVAAVIAIPWAVWFMRRNPPRADWRIPYLA